MVAAALCESDVGNREQDRPARVAAKDGQGCCDGVSKRPSTGRAGVEAAKTAVDRGMKPRRSGRARAEVTYRLASDDEEDDPIESSSGDDGDDGDGGGGGHRPARRAPARGRAAAAATAAAPSSSGGVDLADDLSDDDQRPHQRQRQGPEAGAQRDWSEAPAAGGGAGKPAAVPEADSDSDFVQAAAPQGRQARAPRPAAAAAGRAGSSEPGSGEEDALMEDDRDSPSEAPSSDEEDAAASSGSDLAPGGRRRRARAGTGEARATRSRAAGGGGGRQLRRSIRAAAAASEDEAPVARPRRAAAAAATAATAAALHSEAQALRLQSSSPGEEDGEPESDSGAGAGSSSSDDDDDSMADDSSSDGEAGGRRRGRASPPPRRQPVRGARLQRRTGASIASEDGSAGGALESSEQEPAAGGSSRGGDSASSDGTSSGGAGEPARGRGARRQPQRTSRAAGIELSAFALGSGKDATAAAAAALAAKAARAAGGGGGGSGRPSPRSSLDSGKEATAAALDAAEAEAGEVADPALFVPRVVAKLGRKEEVEKVVAVRYEDDGAMMVLVKLQGQPYRRTVWVPSSRLQDRIQLVRNFVAKQAEVDEGAQGQQQGDAPNIDPRWYQVERVVQEHRPRKGGDARFLVKWSGLEYVDATWEDEAEVARDGMGRAALARFRAWSRPPARPPRPPPRPAAALLEQKLLPDFRNGRALRDYQETSLHWMVNNYRGTMANGRWKPRNCILGDEMGLGKTAQSISVMAWLRQYGGATHPFLVVAPLTTLGHWQREIQTWTDMNVVLYSGSAANRQLIRETEFYHEGSRGGGAGSPRFQVLLVSYETVLKDRSELRRITYEAIILDEAHRLKSRTSATRAALLELPVRWWLLLSGTPVQNNMRELQGLMSVLDDEAYGDLDEFISRFGDERPTLEQIRSLQEALAPVLLRRMKEDVEDLPEKEEVVIWVEMTHEQRMYYKALYAQQIGALLGGASNKNLPGMRNLAMELRKLTCHPFLCDGLEEDMAARWAAAQAAGAAGGAAGANAEVEALVRASGKMLLLHKLLPKLRAEGRQVLIFSQFKIMLDVLEDYLAACGHRFERIDGNTHQRDRQAAIDRFMAAGRTTPGASRAASPADGADGGGAAALGGTRGGSAGGRGGGSREGSAAPEAPFVFLLSTRAGGQGITLTSADTVILYDSDWNPQNDLQAMARCHRIGQDREVTVYRLVTKDTYEQRLFETASRKYGLDEAVLGFGGAGDNPENDAARIEQLLRLGAHALAGAADAEAAGEDKGMAAEDIEQILAGRSEKRQLGSRKGNTFSVAHFAAAGPEGDGEPQQEGQPADGQPQGDGKDAKAFWTELLPDAVASHAAAMDAARQPEVLGRRRRAVVDYREHNGGGRRASASSDSDSQSTDSGRRGTKRPAGGDSGGGAGGGEGNDEAGGKKPKAKKSAAASVPEDPELGRVIKPWSNLAAHAVERAMLRYGPDRPDKILEESGVHGRQLDEVQQLCRALVAIIRQLATLQRNAMRAASAVAAASAAANAQRAPGATAAADGAAAAPGPAPHVRSGGSGWSCPPPQALRDALAKAGVEQGLPPSCSRALMSFDAMRRLGHNPVQSLEVIEAHQAVHKIMVRTGHARPAPGAKLPQGGDGAKGVGPAAGAAEAGASTPRGEQPPPTEGGEAAARAPQDPGSAGKKKRQWVVPRVLAMYDGKLPRWWSRDCDDRLVRGCYDHGWSTKSTKLAGIAEDILRDPRFGFTNIVALDPLQVAKQQLAMLPPVPQQPAPPQQPGQAAAQPAGQPQQPAGQPQQPAGQPQQPAGQPQQPAGQPQQPAGQPQQPAGQPQQPAGQPQQPAGQPQQPAAAPQQQQQQQQAVAALAATALASARLQEALQERRAMAARVADPSMLQWMGPADWRKLVGSVAARLKRVRGCMLDPNYEEPPSPRKEPLLPIVAHAPAAGPSALLAAAAGLQARLTFTATSGGDLMYKGKRVMLGGIAAPGGGAAAAAPAKAPAAAAAPAAAPAPAAARPLVVSLVDGDDELVADDKDFMQHVTKKQRAAPGSQRAAMFGAAGSKKPKPAAPAPAGGAAGPSNAAARPSQPAATPAAAVPPASGLVVRRAANAELSEDQRSVDVDEPLSAGGGGGGATPAGGLGGSGKQQMQQLLGSAQRAATASGAGGDAGQPEHPVYGTPAGASPAAKPGGGGSGKRHGGHAAKEDRKQRKLNEFFTSSKAG